MIDLVVIKERGFTIETDGKTLWVNGPSGCVGRFSLTGTEVFNETHDQIVVCKFDPDWELFVSEMQTTHDIDVSMYQHHLQWFERTK